MLIFPDDRFDRIDFDEESFGVEWSRLFLTLEDILIEFIDVEWFAVKVFFGNQEFMCFNWRLYFSDHLVVINLFGIMRFVNFSCQKEEHFVSVLVCGAGADPRVEKWNFNDIEVRHLHFEAEQKFILLASMNDEQIVGLRYDAEIFPFDSLVNCDCYNFLIDWEFIDQNYLFFIALIFNIFNILCILFLFLFGDLHQLHFPLVHKDPFLVLDVKNIFRLHVGIQVDTMINFA